MSGQTNRMPEAKGIQRTATLGKLSLDRSQTALMILRNVVRNKKKFTKESVVTGSKDCCAVAEAAGKFSAFIVSPFHKNKFSAGSTKQRGCRGEGGRQQEELRG